MNKYFYFCLVLYTNLCLLADSTAYKVQSFIYVEKNKITQEIYLVKDIYNSILYGEATKNQQQKKESILENINLFNIDGVNVYPISIEHESLPSYEKVKIQYPNHNIPSKITITWNLLPENFLPKRYRDKSQWNLSQMDFSTNDFFNKSNSQKINEQNESSAYVILKIIHEPPLEYILSKTNQILIWKRKNYQELTALEVKSIQKNYTFSIKAFLFILLFLFCIFYKKISYAVVIGFISGFVYFLPWNYFVEIPISYKSIPNVSDQSKKDIFAILHQNIYRAFDYKDKNDIYDALSQSTTGKILEQIYLDAYQNTLDTQKQFYIEKINTIDLQILNNSQPDTFHIKCTWRVEGWVIHMAHKHLRWNEYEAVYSIQNIRNFWKIVDCKILKQVRLQNE